jgi:hypothetical protein
MRAAKEFAALVPPGKLPPSLAADDSSQILQCGSVAEGPEDERGFSPISKLSSTFS